MDWPGDLRADVGRAGAGRPVPAHRRLLPPALDGARHRAAGLVRRRGRTARAAASRSTGSATCWPGGTPRTSTGPGVLTGSHLDSVRDGGAYDGPLGVVSGLAAIDLLRERGFVPTPPARGVGVRRGGGLALRPGLPRLAARRRRHLVDDGPRAARPRRGGAARRAGGGGPRPRARRAGRRPRVAARLLRRAARRAGPRPRRPRAPRSGWPARSGRTGATASTSPARPTTRARPGWRTGTTRC